MKKTLTEWYATKQITLDQTQKLSQIIEPNTLYTLQELNLLSQLPTVPNLTKYHHQSTKWQWENWLKVNYYWLIPLLILCLIYLLK